MSNATIHVQRIDPDNTNVTVDIRGVREIPAGTKPAKFWDKALEAVLNHYGYNIFEALQCNFTNPQPAMHAIMLRAYVSPVGPQNVPRRCHSVSMAGGGIMIKVVAITVYSIVLASLAAMLYIAERGI